MTEEAPGDGYIPIACAVHDSIEILAMRRARVRVDCLDAQGESVLLTGRAVDIQIVDGGEFLVLEVSQGRRLVRLDRIVKIINE